jgi:hypothetical protein
MHVPPSFCSSCKILARAIPLTGSDDARVTHTSLFPLAPASPTPLRAATMADDAGDVVKRKRTFRKYVCCCCCCTRGVKRNGGA